MSFSLPRILQDAYRPSHELCNHNHHTSWIVRVMPFGPSAVWIGDILRTLDEHLNHLKVVMSQQ